MGGILDNVPGACQLTGCLVGGWHSGQCPGGVCRLTGCLVGGWHSGQCPGGVSVD